MLLLAAIVFIGGLIYGYHRMPSILMCGVPSALLIGGSVFKERCGLIPGFVRISSFLGDSSYSLYLLHVLLIDIFIGAFLAVVPHTIVGYITICLGLTILCITIAYLFYEVIERRVVGSLQTMVRSVFSTAIKKPID